MWSLDDKLQHIALQTLDDKLQQACITALKCVVGRLLFPSEIHVTVSQ